MSLTIERGPLSFVDAPMKNHASNLDKNRRHVICDRLPFSLGNSPFYFSQTLRQMNGLDLR